MKDEKTTAPGDEQQADVSLQDALETSYDEMEAGTTDVNEHVEDTSIEEHTDAEVEIPAQDGEEGLETAGEEVVQAEVTDYAEPAPERWPEEIRNHYNALPANMKKVFLEDLYKPMQRAFTDKTTEIADQRKALDPMLQTLNSHAQEFEQAGINPVEAFNRQMAWSAHFAKVGPEQGAKDLAAAYGQVGGQQDAEKSDVYLTPVEKAQQARLDRIEGQLQTRDQQDQQRQQQNLQQDQQQRQGAVRNSISAFANEMQDGKPTHPHLEKVSVQMAGLIKGGLVHRTNEYGQPIPYEQQLGQAYQMACEMDPSIRGLRDTRTRKEQVAKVTAASRDVVSKTPGSDADMSDDRPLGESISDLYDKLDRSAA